MGCSSVVEGGRNVADVSRSFLVRIIQACLLISSVVQIQVVNVHAQVFVDDFDVYHDYHTGAVPVGGIWDGVHNATNGDLDENHPAAFEANGSDGEGNPKPGVLVIDDFVGFPNLSGVPGVAWDDSHTTAPFLYKLIPADLNFVATMKISSQTTGNWSYAPILARHHQGFQIGEPTLPLPANESFITMGSFRNPSSEPDPVLASLLSQAIENGSGGPEIKINGLPADLPLWIRVEKKLSKFTPSWSSDGENFTVVPEAEQVVPTLHGEGMLEVGPSFMMFPGADMIGQVEIDSFEIAVIPTPPPVFHSWNVDSSGDWHNAENWESNAPGTIPGVDLAIGVHAKLGSVITGPSTVTNDVADVEIRKLTLDSPEPYTLVGSKSIVLAPNELHEEAPTETMIEVLQGTHIIETPLEVSSDANSSDNHVHIQSGARIDINNSFNLNGKTVNVTGDGVVNFNDNTDTATIGTVMINGGNVGGTGRINGNLTNGDILHAGGTVSPGASVGTLTVDGVYRQAADGTLAIEIGGTGDGEFDVLDVSSVALLDGVLDVSEVGDYAPSYGDTFQILSAINIVDNGLTLSPEDVGFYEMTVDPVNHGILLEVRICDCFLTGDYNSDGVVNTADYTVWLGALGSDSLPNRNPENTGPIGQADYDSWKAHFGGSVGLASLRSIVPEPSSIAIALILLTLVPVARLRV